jgi:vancomycin resistance protein YoaR
MEKLKKNLETAINALQDAEAAFHQAQAAEQHAKNAVSATHTLKAKAEKESAHEQILERASTVEAALDAFKRQLEADYHKEVEAATVESRRLHTKRLELEAEMADLARQIEVVTEAERPAMDAAVSKENFATQFANYATTYTYDCVRLVQTAAAA